MQADGPLVDIAVRFKLWARTAERAHGSCKKHNKACRGLAHGDPCCLLHGTDDSRVRFRLTSQSCAGSAPPVHCALVLLHCRADHIWAESNIPSHLHCLNPSLVFSALQSPHCGQLPLR